MDLTLTVDDERVAVLDKLRAPLGLTREVVAGMLLRAALATPGAAAHVIRSAVAPAPKRKVTELPEEGPEQFERGWKGYAKAGGRLGGKAAAVESWRALLAETKWTPDEAVRRWAVFVKLTPTQFLPEVHRLLRPNLGNLTDESLEARARRARSEAQRPGQAPGFDADSYEATVARARAGSAPIPAAVRPPAPALDGPPKAPPGPAATRA